MTNSDINYRQVLDDLRLRRAKLDAAISAIEEIIGTGVPSALPPFKSPSEISPKVDGLFLSPQTEEANDGPYAGKTIIAATTEFLQSTGKPQHITRIIDALKRGGLHTNSKSLYRTVYNTLTSHLDKRLVRNKQNVWGLKEWRDGS
jgi:hypothetical protein